MRSVRPIVSCTLITWLMLAGAAAAQQSVTAIPGTDASRSWRTQRLGPDHWHLTGDVEIEQGGTRFFADEVDVFTDTNIIKAKGQVVLATETEHIYADSMEFNTKTELGTFYKANGSATLQGPQKERSQFGTQEPDLFFYGETVEKIGRRKYRVTKGGFTTCVQPTPRWNLTSGSVVLNLDHYALLKNPVLRVKSVPLLYFPVVYYPINKEDRATGFLMPLYGTSTFRGQMLSNAFFWVLGRSQDVTLMHDWFSKTGQGYGAEYRYVASGASQGNVSFYRLNEKATTYTSGGTTSEVQGSKSFQIRGDASQDLPFKLKARGRVDYFSNIRVQQTYNTNIYQATNASRSFGGNLAGSWDAYNASVTIDRTEYFYSETYSSVTGAWPRLYFGRSEKSIGRTPLYFGVNTEYGSAIHQTKSGPTTVDTGLWRADANPVLRFPFTKYQFFTVNSSLGWRYTWWSESLERGAQVQTPITRTYFDMSARVTGPVVNRVWSRPNGQWAQKIKHTIEPWVYLQRITAIDNYDQIIKYDSTDYLTGKTTRITYGLNNRIYVKGRAPEGQSSQSRQFINVGIRQTYYTDARAQQYDYAYSSVYGGTKPSSWSPLSMAVSVAPTLTTTGAFRAEYDTVLGQWRTLGAEGTVLFRDNLTTTNGWSFRRYSQYAVGIAASNHYWNSNTGVSFRRNRVGGSVSFSYDIQNQSFLQRRFAGYYNAQCCGVMAEFQTFNYSSSYGYRVPVTKDRRFNVAFTLAGLGTFSNFLGFFGFGQGYR